MMEALGDAYYSLFPLLVFGPLFLWLLYNFGLKEILKIPREMRHRRRQEAAAAERFETERARKRGKGPVGIVRGANRTAIGFFAQAVTYAWFAAVIGYLASSPPYTFAGAQTARIKLSVSHPGQRKVACRKRSLKELAELPANMRAPQDCPRERWPVHVEMELDGDVAFSQQSRPKGLSGDGPSIFYQAFQVPSGAHRITLRLREKGQSGFDHEITRLVDLAPGRSLAITFDALKGGFNIR
jgi:hypothetical protein